MSTVNLNRVVITGNLTADPDLRSLQSGTSVCSLRIACNTRRKNGNTGEWEDKPNYFNATCPRDAPSRSTGAWSGASGRARTAPSDRRSTSSPTLCSS
jgi:single-stranded DNA-binding protein